MLRGPTEAAATAAQALRREIDLLCGTQFTCFTGAKVQILTQKALRREIDLLCGTQFTCFTGTQVQILTQRFNSGILRDRSSLRLLAFSTEKYKY
jgi:hypothetical protein